MKYEQNHEMKHPVILVDEIRKRMAEVNTNDWRDVVDIELKNRYEALKTASSSQEEFEMKHRAFGKQGERWLLHRELLGLTVDQVAYQVGLSPWELMFIEIGYPSPKGVSETVATQLDKLLDVKCEP